MTKLGCFASSVLGARAPSGGLVGGLSQMLNFLCEEFIIDIS